MFGVFLPSRHWKMPGTWHRWRLCSSRLCARSIKMSFVQKTMIKVFFKNLIRLSVFACHNGWKTSKQKLDFPEITTEFFCVAPKTILANVTRNPFQFQHQKNNYVLMPPPPHLVSVTFFPVKAQKRPDLVVVAGGSSFLSSSIVENLESLCFLSDNYDIYLNGNGRSVFHRLCLNAM